MEGDFALAALEDLAEISVRKGLPGGEAPLDAEKGYAGEEAVDFFGSGKRTGGFGEVSGEFGGGVFFGAVAAAEMGVGAEGVRPLAGTAPLEDRGPLAETAPIEDRGEQGKEELVVDLLVSRFILVLLSGVEGVYPPVFGKECATRRKKKR